MRRAFVLGTLLGLLAVASAAAGTPSVEAAPARLALGPRPAGGVATTAIWLVNTGDRAARLVAAGGPGIETPGFEPFTLAPRGRTARLSLQVDVPRDIGWTVTRTLTVRFAAQPPLTIPVTVEPVEPADAPPPRAPDLVSTPLLLMPDELDFGHVAVETYGTKTLWLINAGEDPVSVDAIRSDCGCLTVDAGALETIAPGRATGVTVRMRAPKRAGRGKRHSAAIILANGPTLHARTRIEAVDPRVARVQAYLDARKRGDRDVVTAMLSDDSRIWFGAREGEGTPRREDGDGPWAGWDREMNQASRTEQWAADGNAVTALLTETNDWYRLLDRPPARIQLTWWLDEEQRIEGFLVAGLPRDPDAPNRYDQFETWAKAHHLEALEELMPDDEIVPSRENAQRWRTLLFAWRRAEGLPIPSMTAWGDRLRDTAAKFVEATTYEHLLATMSPDFRMNVDDGRNEAVFDRGTMRAPFEWDRACRAERRLERLGIAGDKMTAVLHEENDFARLLGLEGWTGRLTMRFDGSGLIQEMRYEHDGAARERAMAPALAWLREHRAEELERVEGVFDGTSAAVWLRLLREWREAETAQDREGMPQSS
ncbi:MAG: DUF1573 domain-containing protein [Planctomycetota bacterium]|jgi:hypothetical protein